MLQIVVGERCVLSPTSGRSLGCARRRRGEFLWLSSDELDHPKMEPICGKTGCDRSDDLAPSPVVDHCEAYLVDRLPSACNAKPDGLVYPVFEVERPTRLGSEIELADDRTANDEGRLGSERQTVDADHTFPIASHGLVTACELSDLSPSRSTTSMIRYGSASWYRKRRW